MDILKNPSDFKKVYAGKKFYTNIFSVHFTKDVTLFRMPVFGFTVSKKTVSKKAVTRNLVRRRMREATRQYFNDTDFLGYRIVMTAIKNTKDAQWSEYVDCIEYTQRRIKKLESI